MAGNRGVTRELDPRSERRRSVNRREEAAGSAIEGEASVLPGRALTESRQSLHVTPDGTGIRLVLLCQCVRLGGLLLRHIQSLHDRIKYRVTRISDLLGC